MKQIPLISILLLAACSGVPKNDCLRRAASAEIAVTESYESTSALLTAGIINKETAQKALKSTDAANALVNSAGKLCQVDEPTASNYLLEASSLLLEVNAIIGD